MCSFKAVFDAYGGDYETTIDRFMRKESMYLQILDMLPRDGNMDKLQEAIEQQNLEEAFEAAHTLKGISGNLGLTPFYRAICEIVEPLRLGDGCADYKALLSNIQQEFEKVERLRVELTVIIGS